MMKATSVNYVKIDITSSQETQPITYVFFISFKGYLFAFQL